MNRRNFTVVGTAIALSGWHRLATAQAWPTKPIRMLLSQPAGSGPDAMARIIGEQLTKKWGQPIVVENKPGGQNTIGATLAARAAPDGYNFYFATVAALVTNAYLFKTLTYDPRKDFVPVGMVGKVPFVLCVNSTSPFKTMRDFVAYAKSHPGKLNIANEGPKTFGGMMTRLLAAKLGMQATSVAYLSVGTAITDTVGGFSEAVLTDVPSASELIRAGRLRPLAVTTARRVSGLDDVPPIADVLPGFDYAGWLAIVAPKGTPADVIARFNQDLGAVLADKDVVERIQKIGPRVEWAGGPEQLGRFINSEHERWAHLTQEIGVLPE